MDLSFRAFATAKGFNLPVKMSAVAASLNFSPPVSLRALIGTAAPYMPILISFDTAASGTSFVWYDEANLPPWIWEADGSQYGPPNPLRQATSFEFKLWQSPSGTLFVDDTIPNSTPSGSGLPVEFSPGVLTGAFIYQITAFNSFGSASTAQLGPISITPPAGGPTITVKATGATGTNSFKIQGTGFDAWIGQPVNVNVDVGATFALSQVPVPTAQVNGQGGFIKKLVATVCSGNSGAPLRFSVSQQGLAGSISNLVFKTCQ